MGNTTMELCLDDIPGNKMMNKIKTFLKAYRDERYRQNVSTIENPKTGLSPAQRERLLTLPRYNEGTAMIFGQPFHYTDALGFLHSLDELFGEETYKFFSESEQPVVIDCGANMGLSVLYFKKLYPKSRIIAFEPDVKTFNILQKNVRHLPDVELRQEAVWTENTQIKFYSEGSLANSAVVDFSGKNKVTYVNAVDFKQFLNSKIDFLKIDIEGAENELIFHIKNDLSNVQHLFLEYHGLIGQEQNLGEILNLLKDIGFQYYIRVAGETIKFPFIYEKPQVFNQQLNILCYRI